MASYAEKNPYTSLLNKILGSIGAAARRARVCILFVDA
jgi:hypothetical protein